MQHKILQVLHGCRQFVLWNVWLSPLTNVTFMLYCLIFIFFKIKKFFQQIFASDKLEEVENDVKYVWP